MSEKSDLLPCSDAQEWERWRNAGELLGRIRKGLGFGDAALYQDESGLGSFRIQWWFNVKGERYSAAYIVTDEELSQAFSIELTADSIIERWKNDAREKLG
jgi:hypothetical protein